MDFFPKIDRSTRITNTSATLIGNILTNILDKNLFSGIWTATVSDHLPVFITLPHQLSKRGTCIRFEKKRVYSAQNFEVFQKELNAIDWSIVYNTQDMNEKYTCF